MIESYSFGRMKIDGLTYTSDLIVFPDHVKSGWWRIKGHELHVEDLESIFKVKPEIIVVGTGKFGLVKILPETDRHLQAEGVKLIAEKTGKAYKIYNELSKTDIVGAFHLTC